MNSEQKNNPKYDLKKRNFFNMNYALFTLSYLSTTVAVFLIVFLINKCGLTFL